MRQHSPRLQKRHDLLRTVWAAWLPAQVVSRSAIGICNGNVITIIVCEREMPVKAASQAQGDNAFC